MYQVYHRPRGTPCSLCGLPDSAHRYGDRVHKRHRPDSDRIYYVGIDGEGVTLNDRHSYVRLCYSDASGTKRQTIEAPSGLSTVQCLEFILSVPNFARIYAFAFGYDLTHVLKDLPDEILYKLMRPELRQRTGKHKHLGPKSLIWNGYVLNKVGTKFSVRRGNRLRTIWDVFAFYQSKFTSALEDWFSREVSASEPYALPDPTSKTGYRRWPDPTVEVSVVERMRLMKDKRAQFDRLSNAEILAYCYSECAYMARLAERLVEAHEEVGLNLRSFYGAGSTASCILKKLGIDKAKRDAPPELLEAIASAFAGGRFDNAIIGEIAGPIYGKDISSAYPYHLTFLPCLECGRWEHTTKRSNLKDARTAIVSYSLVPSPNRTWGPFPFRLKNGSICYPEASGGGWVWLDEYLQGERLFSGVQFLEAWVYRCDCGHRPFAEIPIYYRERLRIGKEGPGIVIKLGINSCYGKLAQSVGVNPPFQSWIWSGMTTSGCRAQVLELMGLHSKPEALLMIATDGVYSTENVVAPEPKYTATLTEHKKPLGGWETTIVPQGMFAARPGIYFPLNPSENDVKKVRARGVGRANMLANWQGMVNAYKEGQPSFTMTVASRFYGAKTCVSISGKEGSYVYERNPLYGQWKPRPIELKFDPMPKRKGIRKDGSLILCRFPQSWRSVPYKKTEGIGPEAFLLKQLKDEMLEQADGDDYADYEDC